MILTYWLTLIDCPDVHDSTEWAVAKQRWQRRKSPTDVDIEQEIATATLLPGYKEKIYL